MFMFYTALYLCSILSETYGLSVREPKLPDALVVLTSALSRT